MRRPTLRFASILLPFATLALATMAWTRSAAGNESAAVTGVAQNYMSAYYTADAALMQRVLHPDFHKRTLRTVNGHTEITEDTALSMMEGVRAGSGRTFPPDQRVQKIQVLDIYKDAASVKVVTSRWIDYMHLTRLNGEWRVLDVVLQYTN
jgi:hypothetical protein